MTLFLCNDLLFVAEPKKEGWKFKELTFLKKLDAKEFPDGIINFCSAHSGRIIHEIKVSVEEQALLLETFRKLKSELQATDELRTAKSKEKAEETKKFFTQRYKSIDEDDEFSPTKLPNISSGYSSMREISDTKHKDKRSESLFDIKSPDESSESTADDSKLRKWAKVRSRNGSSLGIIISDSSSESVKDVDSGSNLAEEKKNTTNEKVEEKSSGSKIEDPSKLRKWAQVRNASSSSISDKSDKSDSSDIAKDEQSEKSVSGSGSKEEPKLRKWAQVRNGSRNGSTIS